MSALVKTNRPAGTLCPLWLKLKDLLVHLSALVETYTPAGTLYPLWLKLIGLLVHYIRCG
jgi:hypothetical protein